LRRRGEYQETKKQKIEKSEKGRDTKPPVVKNNRLKGIKKENREKGKKYDNYRNAVGNEKPNAQEKSQVPSIHAKYPQGEVRITHKNDKTCKWGKIKKGQCQGQYAGVIKKPKNS